MKASDYSKVVFFLMLLLGISCKPNAQTINSFKGKWIIYNTIGLITSDNEDKLAMHKACVGKQITIADSALVVDNKNAGCIVVANNSFRTSFIKPITKSEANEEYSFKFVEAVFNNPSMKLDKVGIYKTTYTLENDDDLEEMLLIKQDDSHIVLYLYDYLVFLKRTGK